MELRWHVVKFGKGWDIIDTTNGARAAYIGSDKTCHWHAKEYWGIRVQEWINAVNAFEEIGIE